MTLGKGIAGGVLPLSAVGVQGSHFEAVRKKSGAFVHGGTHTHHPVAAAAGLSVLRILEREDLIAQVEVRGKILGDLLQERLGDHPHVADVRGIGFLWGVELVKDKGTLVCARRGRLQINGTGRPRWRCFYCGTALYRYRSGSGAGRGANSGRGKGCFGIGLDTMPSIVMLRKVEDGGQIQIIADFRLRIAEC
jgi:hypothetical protein